MNLDHDTLARMPLLAQRYRSGLLPAAEYAALYALYWQFARHGGRLALRRSRDDPRPDGATWLAELDAMSSETRLARLIELLERYDLREVSRRVNVALLGWLRGQWALTPCEQIPTVREVLRMQVRGTRPVTIIADYPRLLEPVEGKADCFAFICHDLEHAWQFFHDPDSLQSQRRFAEKLERALEAGVFAPYLTDPVFAKKFDYLAADMNTHVAHSLQYLRAILLEFHLRAEGRGPREQLRPDSRTRLDRCLSAVSEGLGRREAGGAWGTIPLQLGQ